MAMKHINFVTIYPQMIQSGLASPLFCKAQDVRAETKFRTINLRNFATDQRGTVDSSPYGGGDGMVMRPEPLRDAIQSVAPSHVVLLSASGRPFKQNDAERLANLTTDITLLCGRFGGIDQRLIDGYVDEEISVGDFVCAGGELPALLVLESIIRLWPGVLGNEKSFAHDSYCAAYDGLLEEPVFSRPEEFEGKKVPEVLLSGNHQAIAAWRAAERLKRTAERRPDLL
jgi:tRNA (guanine37-N1)-methyltransferase